MHKFKVGDFVKVKAPYGTPGDQYFHADARRWQKTPVEIKSVWNRSVGVEGSARGRVRHWTIWIEDLIPTVKQLTNK